MCLKRLLTPGVQERWLRLHCHQNQCALQTFYFRLPFRSHSENACCNCNISAGVHPDWMNYFLWTVKIKMRESYFQLMLLNPTPGISTYFNIKWKQKSSTIHRTNEDHQKENRKWGIVIIQGKDYRSTIEETCKPEIKTQKVPSFIHQGAVLGNEDAR